MDQGPSKTLGQTSDLVVLAPWREQLIGADEAIRPSSRWIRTFRTLYQIRRTAREATDPQAFSDPIERLEQVHSFRVKATDEGMLLSVTYDFGWDPYMRTLWKDARPFLDLLLCDCLDYPLARKTGVDQWAQWIRDHEKISDYFYSATPLTVSDLFALPQAERLQREEDDSEAGDLKLAGFYSRNPADIAADNRARAPASAMQQALGILSAMFRLTRFYGSDVTAGVPLAEDALTLLLATKALLLGFDPATVPAIERERFARELAWFAQPAPTAAVTTAACPAPAVNRADIQRGILTGFDKPQAITHGAMLFLMVTDPGKARASLAGLDLSNEQTAVPAGSIFRNIAFSYRGMQELTFPAEVLEAMPDAFKEGAAARAGQVGDIRTFHPTRWRPLMLNWPKPKTANVGTADIALVDVIIQLRIASKSVASDIYDRRHPLHAEVARLHLLDGLKLLSVQPTGPANPQAPGEDHFGFQDGISQPSIEESRSRGWSDSVAAGELLLGYPNDAHDVDDSPAAIRGGSFLAIRNMMVRPDRFQTMVAEAAGKTGLAPDVIIGKILGRSRQGTPLVAHESLNDFLFSDDPDGSQCPRQSHVRRLNPRGAERIPRIVRRGMSYVPLPSPYTAPGDRGTMFMAYCADLGEQYEVLLRWLNGGNSSRLHSALGDPLCGVPETGRTRIYRFRHQSKSYRIALPATRDAPVALAWSGYFFAPPPSLVKALSKPPVASAPKPTKAEAEIWKRAQKIVAQLEAEEAGKDLWRPYLDEPTAQASGLQAAIWKFIRDHRGGLLLTPDMALVASHALVIEVLRDDGRRFSVSGAGDRIKQSIEQFHLGLDAHTDAYKREAPASNDALRAVTKANAFEQSRKATKAVLSRLLAGRSPPLRVDVMRDLLEPAMAEMAVGWFDFPDGEFILPGPSDWRPVKERKPVFPGDFWNSSRYAFNPFTAARTEALSAEHGQAILNAADQFIAKFGRTAFKGSVSKAIAEREFANGVLSYPGDRDLARGIIGSMLGWIATTLGNFARLFDMWIPANTLQRQQILWNDSTTKDAAEADRIFGTIMEATICRAPVPENKWRVVMKKGEELGGKIVRPTEQPVELILGLQSAAADQQANNTPDSYIPFGMAMPANTPKPPHGCPAREMSLGIVLGVLAALAETVNVRDAGGRLVIDISPR